MPFLLPLRFRHLAFVPLLASACGFAPPLVAQPANADSVSRLALRLNPAANFDADDHALLEDLQRASFQFFVEQAHPETGLVRDRARADGSPSEGKASISASGFALASWAVATERGWVDRPRALERVRQMLRFLATRAQRQHGFFYHFMEMDTGERAWNCELSSIDTGLFLAGAIVAREYFQDPEITRLVDQLYHEVDWTWFLNGGETVAMGWHDEAGFSRFRWTGYSEHTTMSILGLGAPEHALDRSYWQAWLRKPTGTYAGYHFIQGPPLFIHQFAHAYVDFRDLRDAYADYYHNSVLATLAQRQFCIDLRYEFPSWSERLWGLTASDSATGYKAWGGPPRTSEFNSLDGTIVPCATAGSLPFAPFETMTVLRHLRTVYGDRIWKRYGFVDAFNPETGWINPDVIGIDQGISILQAENARTGLIWALFMRAPEVQRALGKAGFVSKSRNLSWSERDRMRSLAADAWNSFASAPLTADSAGLRLTAVAAAHALGLIDGGAAAKQTRALLAAAEPPDNDVAAAEYAAALITLRNAFPSLSAEVAPKLEAIKWDNLSLSSTKLGSASRLAAFLKLAAGKDDGAAWKRLVRTPEKVGPVFALSPADPADQLTPGLWLDEAGIVTGGSAAQLAYAKAVEPSTSPATTPPDVLTAALLVRHLPKELLKAFAATPPPADWLARSSIRERATLLLATANLLVPECLTGWFQQDPLVLAARARLPEFAQAAFGQNTSILWRQELAGPFVEPPERRAVAVAANLPREQWQWVRVTGLEFKDSPGDVRPDDPMLELRFAFTWDNEALHFHAVAVDTPPGYTRPAERKEFVELLVDPDSNGLVWRGPDDFQFIFRSTGQAIDWTHNRPIPASIERNEHGYTIEVSLPWSTLALTPKPGLEFRVSAAIATDARYEWEPSLKLNWRFVERRDERYSLGILRLE